MESLGNAQDAFPDGDSHQQISIMESGYMSTTDTEHTTDTQRMETPAVLANAQAGMTQLQAEDVIGSMQMESNETYLVSTTPESGYSSNHVEDVENVTDRSMNSTLVENSRTTTAVTRPVQHPPENVMLSRDRSGEQESQSQGNLLVAASISSESHDASDQRQRNIPEEPPPFDPSIPDIPDMTENSFFVEELQAVEETPGTPIQESENSDDFDVHLEERAAFLRTAYNYVNSTDVCDVDLTMMHQLRRKGDLPFPRFCLSCFRSPVSVQNLPCGCICNCWMCARLMRCCARCQSIIRHYRHLN